MSGSKLIPFFGIDRQYQEHRDELLNAADEVWRTGKVLDGDRTVEFENKIAQRCNRKFAIAVNSCSQGLLFSQLALGLQPSKRIAIPAVSFTATLNNVLMAGNRPVFCDVDQRAMLDLFEVDIHEKQVDAVMYVNMFGNILDYDKLHDICNFWSPNNPIPIIEDAAQSFGGWYKDRPSGSLGDVSVLSFDPTKNLPNYGSGGMILTDDYDTARFCRDIRNNASQEFTPVGTNSRMSEADCAQMLVKLKYFDAWQERRRDIAEYYIENLYEYMDIVLPNKFVEHAWHKFVVHATFRSKLSSFLTENNIETRIHYRTPLYDRDAAFDYIDYAHDSFPGAVTHCHEALSLPIYPELTDAEVEYIVDTIKRYL